MRSLLLRHLRAFPGRTEGVAAVEAALVLPVLLALGGGVMEFGVAMYRLQLVEAGVRDAARYLARMPDPALAEAPARLLAVTGSITGAAPARVRDWEAGQVQIAYRAVANPRDAATGRRPYRGGDVVQVVRVSTSVPYAGIGFLAAAGLSDLRLSADHEERAVGG